MKIELFQKLSQSVSKILLDILNTITLNQHNMTYQELLLKQYLFDK